MELEIIRKLENESRAYYRYDFITNYKSVSIPYLTFISFFTLTGTFGNFLVLGTLLKVKVSTEYLHSYNKTTIKYPEIL